MQLWNIYHPEIPEWMHALLETDAMQRLQDVGMNCGCEYTAFPIFSDLQPYSRLEHSLGVALIVWHFTEDMTQAAAGLLHDIATPVFAHTVDFLNGDHMTQESTEIHTGRMIREDLQLRQALKENGIAVESVTDYHRYPVADNESPRLSADRLEYTLGNGVNYGFITREQAAGMYQDLLVGSNEAKQPELMFRSRETALAFAKLALRCSGIYVSDEDRYAMQMLSQLLKDALGAGVMKREDLYTQEKAVVQKLLRSPLSHRWKQYCNYKAVLRRNTPGREDGWQQIFAKKRYINPFVLDTGRVSALEPMFAGELAAFLKHSQMAWIKGV